MAQLPEGIDWPPAREVLLQRFGSQILQPFSVYVHVPFCNVRCGYCDFNTYTVDFGDGASRESYADSVIREIAFSTRTLAENRVEIEGIRTIFFGGGTPTLLAPQAIGSILRALGKNLQIDESAEITVEANPETVTKESLAQLRDYGVNRLSIGMQSAVPKVLRVLDRQHRPERVPQVVEWARGVGLEVSLDLIYGTPGETMADWKTSLTEALDMEPDHLSAYSLIVEPGTKLHTQIKRGELPQPSDDVAAEKYEMANTLLANSGFRWYEISNFARVQAHEMDTPATQLGFASKHNLAYWNDWNWWGYGPGAHSHVGGTRWWNIKHPLAYANALQQGRNPALAGEILDPATQDFERLMLQIRTANGVSAGPFAQQIPELVEQGLLEQAPLTVGRIVLSLKGRLMADFVTRTLAGW